MTDDVLPAGGSMPAARRRLGDLGIFGWYNVLVVVGGLVRLVSGDLRGLVGIGVGRAFVLMTYATPVQRPKYRFGRARDGERGWGRGDTYGALVLLVLAAVGEAVAIVTRSGWIALVTVLLALALAQVLALLGIAFVMLHPRRKPNSPNPKP